MKNTAAILDLVWELISYGMGHASQIEGIVQDILKLYHDHIGANNK